MFAQSLIKRSVDFYGGVESAETTFTRIQVILAHYLEKPGGPNSLEFSIPFWDRVDRLRQLRDSVVGWDLTRDSEETVEQCPLQRTM